MKLVYDDFEVCLRVHHNGDVLGRIALDQKHVGIGTRLNDSERNFRIGIFQPGLRQHLAPVTRGLLQLLERREIATAVFPFDELRLSAKAEISVSGASANQVAASSRSSYSPFARIKCP